MSTKTNELQPGWKNSPTYSKLSADVEASSGIQDDIRTTLENYKIIKDGGKAVKVKPGKSSVRPKMVRKYQEWQYPAREEPFLNTPNMFQLMPRGPKDAPAAAQNGMLLNYQYETLLDKVSLVGNVVRVITDEGTVIVKTGWESKYEMKMVTKQRPIYASAEDSLKLIEAAMQSGQMDRAQAQEMLMSGEPMQVGIEDYEEEEEVLTKNQPTHTVLDGANVGIDPNCEGDLSKAGFIWHEYDTSWSELIKNRYEELEDGTTRGYYKNIDEALAADSSVAYFDNKSKDYSNFVYDDKARKKFKAVEYWGYWDIQGDGVLVSIVAEWVGSVLVRLEENPYPHKRLPFSIAYDMPVLRSTRGEPVALLLDDNQDSNGRMARAMHDITSTAATGQEFIDANFFSSIADKNQYEKGNTVYFNSQMDPKRSIYRRTVDPIDNSILQVMQLNTQEAENFSGTKPFDGMKGGQGLGLTKMSLDATAKRELSVLRRISALFIDMAKMVISMNQAYMDENQTIRITDTEFVEIARDDLQGDFDLRVSISTPEKDDQQAQSLMTLLQTNAASMPPQLYAKTMGKILRLQYQPDLAEEYEQFKPEPDPMQVKIQEMQMENARLQNEVLKMDMIAKQSLVEERTSRMIENTEADIANKLAQAELRAAQAELALAQAEKAKSESDMLDQKFIDKDSGSAREREVQDLEYAATVKNHLKMLDVNKQKQGGK